MARAALALSSSSVGFAAGLLAALAAGLDLLAAKSFSPASLIKLKRPMSNLLVWCGTGPLYRLAVFSAVRRWHMSDEWRGKTLDNALHDFSGHRRGQHTPEVGAVRNARPAATCWRRGRIFDHIDRLSDTAWARLPAPTRMLGCVVAGDAVKRRVEEQMELGCRAAVGGVLGPGGGTDQWLMTIPSRWDATAGRHDRCAPPYAGAGPGAAAWSW